MIDIDAEFDEHNETAEIEAALAFAERVIERQAIYDVDALVEHLATLNDAARELLEMREDMSLIISGDNIPLPCNKKHAEAMVAMGSAYLKQHAKD